MKKIIRWLLAAVAVATIYNTPTEAADICHKAVSAVSTAGERASEFVGAML